MDIQIHLRKKQESLNKLTELLLKNEYILSQHTANDLKNGTYLAKIS